jgi:hypothetical protein
MYEIKSNHKAPAPDGTEYNDLPANWTAISEKEFAQSDFFIRVPVSVESRQPISDRVPRNMWVFWYEGGNCVTLSRDFYKGTVTYGKGAACEHEMVPMSTAECTARGITGPGLCYHVSRCTKCDHVSAVDSSD